MEEWERRVAPGQHEEPYEGLIRIERTAFSGEREPSWRAGDGLRVLNP
jgi:hypothetical protein